MDQKIRLCKSHYCCYMLLRYYFGFSHIYKNFLENQYPNFFHKAALRKNPGSGPIGKCPPMGKP